MPYGALYEGRRYVAEAIGTFALVAIGPGAVWCRPRHRRANAHSRRTVRNRRNRFRRRTGDWPPHGRELQSREVTRPCGGRRHLDEPLALLARADDWNGRGDARL